jgi:hypothetical protein
MHPRLKAGVCLIFALLHSFPVPTAQATVSPEFLEAHGARLERLFTELDPDHPVVGPIRREWYRGERMEAAAALSRYFASKQFPIEVLEPITYPANLLEQAEAALEDRFYLLEYWETVPRLNNGGLDWKHRGAAKDKEWAWMLNRHGIFPDLAEAYRLTGDVAYVEYLNEIWQDWITNNSYPDHLTFSEPWRPLEVARRILHAWVHLFYNEQDLLNPETRLLILSSLLDHGDALREHASFWGGNHLISEKLALLTLAFAWPELTNSADWRSYAIEQVSRQLMDQTYPDGSYKELSNHYQRVVLRNAQYFVRIMARLDPGFRERQVMQRIEEMWDFFARVTQPDGSGPVNNASDREENAAFLQKVDAFYNRPDWRYIATNGREGIAPAGSASRLFPWAGQAILRNGWSREADWVYFDAGPYGTAHQHIDRLHVSASLGGRPTLVDNGRYTYQPGPWRDYFKGPQGHNLILLDDKPAEQAPREVENKLPVPFSDLPEVAMAAATADFKLAGFAGLPGLEKKVPWTRAVLLDRRGFLLVIDHLVTFSEHDLGARWHFHPDISEAEAISYLRLIHPTDLPVRFKSLVGSAPPDVGGFYSPDYNQKVPAPELRFNLRIDRPTTLVWLLQPPGTATMRADSLSQPGAPVLKLRLFQGEKPSADLHLRLYPEAELIEYKAHRTSY